MRQKNFSAPVIQQALDEPRDRRDEGDPRLPPGLLLDLLQQAAQTRGQGKGAEGGGGGE